jgi:class 3 adenylate cyclase
MSCSATRTLDKFVGDMDCSAGDRPAHGPAVAAAIEMSAALSRLNAAGRCGQPVLDIDRNQLGVMIAGTQSIMSYTVIGDAVNLGSRSSR